MSLKSNRYNVNYIFCDGKYNIWVDTNYVIKAENEVIAMKEALTIEGKISQYVKVYYCTGKKDIVVSVIDNPYFNEAFITKYTICDKTKDKKDFVNSLEDDYDGYFSIYKSNLIFEPISFGVNICKERRE